MSMAEKLHSMTVAEYLQSEEKASERREFVNGRVFAMTGANRRHEIIAGNLFAALHQFLAGTSCRPFMENFKVYIKTANCFYYPDVMVACDQQANADDVFTEEPVLVIEVLSRSTSGVDRREKLMNYLEIPSLREYVLVHQRRRKVETYRKDSEGTWTKIEFATGEDLEVCALPKGKLNIPIDLIYAAVEFNPQDFEVREQEEAYAASGELDWAHAW